MLSYYLRMIMLNSGEARKGWHCMEGAVQSTGSGRQRDSQEDVLSVAHQGWCWGTGRLGQKQVPQVVVQ